MAVERFSLASLVLRLQARPESVPALRGRVRAWLEDAGASKTDTFEVLLATTEAFTNAVQHPHEPSSHLALTEKRPAFAVASSFAEYVGTRAFSPTCAAAAVPEDRSPRLGPCHPLTRGTPARGRRRAPEADVSRS